MLTWSRNSIISNAAANQDTESAITDTKLYILVVILSTKDNYYNNWNQVLKGQLTGININPE